MGQNKTDPTAALEHNRALLEQVIHSPDAQRLMEERKARREKEFSKVIESFSKMRN